MANPGDVVTLGTLIGRTLTVYDYALDEVGNWVYPFVPREVAGGVLAAVHGHRNDQGGETVTLVWADGSNYDIVDSLGGLSLRVE